MFLVQEVGWCSGKIFGWMEESWLVGGGGGSGWLDGFRPEDFFCIF